MRRCESRGERETCGCKTQSETETKSRSHVDLRRQIDQLYRVIHINQFANLLSRSPERDRSAEFLPRDDLFDEIENKMRILPLEFRPEQRNFRG